ncbi:MAG TPA: site-specific integrase, partial [Actinomycetota bacterium]|nr:site-specific integrase [Actinomycetota bacterium]
MTAPPGAVPGVAPAPASASAPSASPLTSRSLPASSDSGPAAWAETQLDRATLAKLAEELPVGSQDPEKRRLRRHSVDGLLGWLATWPGGTWQERWRASGSETLGKAWAAVPAAALQTHTPRPPSPHVARRGVIVGISALLCLRVLRPGYAWLFAAHLTETYGWVRELTDPEFFAEALERCRAAGTRERHQLDAMHHLSRVTLHTGRGPRQLSPADLLDYHATLRALGRQADVLTLAWDLLRDLAVFPAGTPSLRAALRRGQRSIAELVDSYQLTCRPVRDVLVRYLSERAASLDYSSLTSLAGRLVGAFWKDLETHHPGICSLDLAPEVAAAWKLRAARKRRPEVEGQARTDPYGVLFAVRAFYLDLAQWALEDPSWTPWAVPCPVRLDDVRGSMKHKRRRTATMHQRTRTLAPLLPQLVASVEDRLGHLERLVAAAAATSVGGRFEVDGESFERIQAASDRKRGGQAGAGRLRARRLTDDQRLDLTRDEDEAFWIWAIVETLRHTGMRLEELLELTHLALVTHTLPDTGEVVPLLQVAPSKTDAERLLLVSPELAHVLARIVHRVRAGQPDVPLVARYDQHERLTGAPLPHLFQRWHGTERRVMCPAAVKRLLGMAIDRAGLRLQGADGRPLRYTPHDFRRIFATEAVSGGLPVHIAAQILGHQDLGTTQAYTAVYQDDVLRHYRAFIAGRRAQRPSEEYREPTAAEWAEFEQHFTKRKVELGTCARPYGTPCRHEHACFSELDRRGLGEHLDGHPVGDDRIVGR